MYELKKIKGIGEVPSVQIFEDHSPFIIGVSVYFVGRQTDNKMLVTSPVLIIAKLHDNITEITTKNSVYEVTKL